MSLAGRRAAEALMSFPRVSGDEPAAPVVYPWPEEFSPRERG